MSVNSWVLLLCPFPSTCARVPACVCVQVQANIREADSSPQGARRAVRARCAPRAQCTLRALYAIGACPRKFHFSIMSPVFRRRSANCWTHASTSCALRLALCAHFRFTFECCFVRPQFPIMYELKRPTSTMKHILKALRVPRTWSVQDRTRTRRTIMIPIPLVRSQIIQKQKLCRTVFLFCPVVSRLNEESWIPESRFLGAGRHSDKSYFQIPKYMCENTFDCRCASVGRA